jgi:hypothetical protein
MLHRKAIWLLVVVFLFPVISCTRLDEAPPKGTVLLGTEKLSALDSIPSEWGKLVSVSATPIYDGILQLWFQDENGKVRMVPFDIRNSRLVGHAVVVPRK